MRNDAGCGDLLALGRPIGVLPSKHSMYRERASAEVAHTVCRFPCTSHVQHSIYFLNIQMNSYNIEKKTDETLKTSIWNTCETS
jgi:hypothetical protein